jgi:virulence factor Mce-like protein
MLTLLANVKWGAAFLAVITAALLSSRSLLPAGGYELKVPMPSAHGLYPGSDVLIAGSRAGTVNSINLAGEHVVVGITLDPAHSPVHSDAQITMRPKSLLGEEYLDLKPGSADVLNSGATLPGRSVKLSTDLEDVINTFDQPTREKLRTVLIELGGGVAGRGVATNETIRYGTGDLSDLADITDTIARRDAELERVIQSLDTVTNELAQSDRRVQLGELIKNSDRLLKNLADQDVQLKRALTQSNAALGRTDSALSGTDGNLASIFRQAPTLVHRTSGLMADLNVGADSAVRGLPTQIQSIRETAVVFGGKDANGYATRISILVGASSPGAAVPSGAVQASSALDDSDIFRFLLGART